MARGEPDPEVPVAGTAAVVAAVLVMPLVPVRLVGPPACVASLAVPWGRSTPAQGREGTFDAGDRIAAGVAARSRGVGVVHDPRLHVT